MGEEAHFILDEGNEEAETETSHKVFRRRKKQLYQSIRKQMEFYFSDSNLTKDRFLGNLLKENPCVDLSIFTRFNKIRALTTDVSDIAKALRHSELLSLTEDGTKVFRTKPVQQKENIDDCTIYVEQLPPDANHDWLRDVFSAYGNVAYVSIPKYRTSGKIKGFAFVEFDTPEEANKTLEAFGARGCRLSSEIAPDKLCSIATFETDEASNVEETNHGEPSSEKEDKQQTIEKDSLQHKRKRRSSHKESIKDLDTEHTLESESKLTQNRGQIFSEEDVKVKTKEGEDCVEENLDSVKADENEKLEEGSSSTKRKRKKHSEEEVEDEEIDPEALKKRRKLLEDQYTVEESTKKKKKKKQDDTIQEEENEDSIASKRIKSEIIEPKEQYTVEVKVEESAKKKRKKKQDDTIQEEENEDSIASKRIKSEIIEPKEQYTVEVKVEESAKKKRKKKQDDTIQEEENEYSIACKRIKSEIIENEDVVPENVQSDRTVKTELKSETEEENKENSNEEEEQVSESRDEYIAEECDTEIVEGESKRRRKRKKKKKNKNDKQDVNASSLQILSKREWKRLRNKYLDLQRAKMKCLKQYLSKQYWSTHIQQNNTDTPESEVSQPRITYTPGVIIHAVLNEPVMDIRKFKADTKALPHVEYVDILQGANVAYIRCTTAEGAKQLASSNPWVSSKILEGEEETKYWDKIMADRKMKFSNKVRTKQRGRDKILRRAERELGKHIKFDE